MWQEKLTEIKEEEKIVGAELNGAASDEDIEKFKKKVNEKLNVELPLEYIRFLQVINGLEFNGYTIYGIDQELVEKKPKNKIDGFIDSNQVWHEVEHQKQYLFFGDGSLSWYVLDKEMKRYKLIAKPEGDELEDFNGFDEMIERIMSDALQ
ncbi:YrhA family protein [Virgibacillus sp. 6R]|uniref:YrhA family protein n=1 Tax=Metabacillus sp. 22489 TaxID=3453928 RepID=UPI00119E12D8